MICFYSERKTRENKLHFIKQERYKCIKFPVTQFNTEIKILMIYLRDNGKLIINHRNF